jgi:hypothetical protein
MFSILPSYGHSFVCCRWITSSTERHSPSTATTTLKLWRSTPRRSARSLVQPRRRKKKITVKIRPVSPTLTLADATRAFMLEGPRKKSKKKVAASDLARDGSAFDAFAAFETPESGAEASPATS